MVKHLVKTTWDIYNNLQNDVEVDWFLWGALLATAKKGCGFNQPHNFPLDLKDLYVHAIFGQNSYSNYDLLLDSIDMAGCQRDPKGRS